MSNFTAILDWYRCNKCTDQCKKSRWQNFCRWGWGCTDILNECCLWSLHGSI